MAFLIIFTVSVIQLQPRKVALYGFYVPNRYQNRRVTRGGEEVGLTCPFSEIGKSALILRKNVLLAVIYELNFSFKVQFLRVLKIKTISSDLLTYASLKTAL